MNKGELMQTVAAETGPSQAEAGDHVNVILSVIEDELKSGGEVNVTGFGKFSVTEHPAHEGINPQTGEKMQIRLQGRRSSLRAML